MKRFFGPNDRTIRLADGRQLGYAEYGDPDGYPLIYFHGGLSSRVDIETANGAAQQAGFRIIAPDRPGIGLSDRQPGYSLLDWSVDVAELADLLEIDKFAVMGWSFGGAYAAVCAFALPQRVSCAVLIASGIPRDWTGMIEQINSMDRTFLKFSGRASIVDRLAFRFVGASAKMTPGFFTRMSVRDMEPASAQAITRDQDGFVRSTIEGMANPAGVVDDYRVWNRPWGFELKDIAVPVQIWHGEADALCPPPWAHRLAKAIPGAELTMVPDVGHLLARDNWPQIFSKLADADQVAGGS